MEQITAEADIALARAQLHRAQTLYAREGLSMTDGQRRQLWRVISTRKAQLDRYGADIGRNPYVGELALAL